MTVPAFTAAPVDPLAEVDAAGAASDDEDQAPASKQPPAKKEPSAKDDNESVGGIDHAIEDPSDKDSEDEDEAAAVPEPEPEPELVVRAATDANVSPKGKFFMHDDRSGGGGGGGERGKGTGGKGGGGKGGGQGERPKKPKDDGKMWGHDMFEKLMLEEQHEPPQRGRVLL